MRRRRREWRLRPRHQVWEHIPTGVCFSVQQIEKHGWNRAVLVVEITRDWRAYLDALPTTTLQKERDALLVQALNERNDSRLRELTLRWSLWHEEATDNKGEGDGG